MNQLSLDELEECIKKPAYIGPGTLIIRTKRFPIQLDQTHFVYNYKSRRWETIYEEALSKFVCLHPVTVSTIDCLHITYHYHLSN